MRKHRRVQVQEDGRTRMRSEAYQDVPAGTRIEFVVCDASRSPLQAIPAADYDGTNADRYYLWEKLAGSPTEAPRPATALSRHRDLELPLWRRGRRNAVSREGPAGAAGARPCGGRAPLPRWMLYQTARAP